MTYDPNVALESIDDNTAVIIACFAVVAVATFTYLVQSFRLAFADRAYSCALPTVGWFAIHDLGFVLQYELWFDTYDHWWLKAWWVALIFTTLIEFALVAVVIKFGHAELAPHLPQRVFAAGVIAILLGITALWVLIKDSIDDELYLVSFPITAFWTMPFATALMLRRRSQRGQTPLQPICVAFVMLGFQGALWNIDDFFREWPFVLFTAMAVVWCLANAWLLSTYPKWQGEDWPARREPVPAGY